MLHLIVVFNFVFDFAICFSYYRDRIPNGKKVFNPCISGNFWNGVGHKDSRGGGSLNKFGEDFKAAGKKWTRDLCLKDSDGDGRPNGMELGDPWCRWTPTNDTILLPVLSHPGICDPLNSTKCNKPGLTPCLVVKQKRCNAIDQAGVQRADFVIPRTSVPAKETVFACMTFNLPRDTDYHIVALEPVVHNRDVLHHIVVFGCNTDYDVAVTGRAFECGFMPPGLCEEPLLVVSAGLETTCLDQESGFLIGKNGHRQIMLQIHWNNPDLRPNFIDHSGVTLHYTKNTRKYNAGVMSVMATKITIPPMSSKVMVESTCPGSCTSSQITSPLKIQTALNHMHLLGVSQNIELIRNGKTIRYITNDKTYDFLDPQIYTFGEPIQVFPGDTIKTTCEYSSLNVSKTVNFGLGTSDEMCLGMLTYYPKEAWTTNICMSYGDIPLCNMTTTGKIKDCDVAKFLKTAKTYETFLPVMQECAKTGTCSGVCLMATRAVRQHPCMKGKLYDMWKFLIIQWEQRIHILQTDPVIGDIFKAFITCEDDYNGSTISTRA